MPVVPPITLVGIRARIPIIKVSIIEVLTIFVMCRVSVLENFDEFSA